VLALSAMSGIILAISFLWPVDAIPGVELCGFHALSGHPCAGCGLTRAFAHISRGGFGDAWALNPLAFPTYLAALAALASPLWARRATGRRPRRWRPRTVVVAIAALAAPALLFGVWRASAVERWSARSAASTAAATSPDHKPPPWIAPWIPDDDSPRLAGVTATDPSSARVEGPGEADE